MATKHIPPPPPRVRGITLQTSNTLWNIVINLLKKFTKVKKSNACGIATVMYHGISNYLYVHLVVQQEVIDIVDLNR